jgi:hypothetical protein
MSIQKRNSKKPGFIRRHLRKVTLVTLFVLGASAPGVGAINVPQGFNSLLDQFRSNPTVAYLVKQYNEIPSYVFPAIQQVLNIPEGDLKTAQGVMGILTPDLKNQLESTSPIDSAVWKSSTTRAAQATSKTVVNRVLGAEGQSNDQQSAQETSNTNEAAQFAAQEASDITNGIQSYSSSQDVLKGVAEVLSRNAAITAAGVSLAASSSRDTRETKLVTATLLQEQSAANQERDRKEQARLLREADSINGFAYWSLYNYQ